MWNFILSKINVVIFVWCRMTAAVFLHMLQWKWQHEWHNAERVDCLLFLWIRPPKDSLNHSSAWIQHNYIKYCIFVPFFYSFAFMSGEIYRTTVQQHRKPENGKAQRDVTIVLATRIYEMTHCKYQFSAIKYHSNSRKVNWLISDGLQGGPAEKAQMQLTSLME